MVRLGLLRTLIFLGLFFYFYKTSGKFRKSIISAFAAMSFYFSGLPSAHSAGGADAFTTQNQPHQSRFQKRQGIFGRKSNNDGSGGDDDKGIPQYSKPESVETTKERFQKIQEQVVKLEEVTDSDSESEEDQCPIDQQNKAGIDELPDSSKFIYTLETKTAKKSLEKSPS